MKLTKTLAVAFAMLLGLTTFGAHAQDANFHVVPMPQSVQPLQSGNFYLDAKTLITYPKGDKALRRNAEYLASFIKESTGLDLLVMNGENVQKHCIRLTQALKNDNKEAYNLRVNSDIILINGASEAGVFYGIQTLRKSLPTGKSTQIMVPGVEVKDAPRFGYRGAMLDVARHFVSKDSVLRFIDMLALHNINRFHWHLTDDQGWRIEIKKYPKLTKIGSMRPETVIGHNSGKFDGKPHGGFYTQKELKQIVKYAQDRYITIIPEIDLPGHMQAALAAYPEFGCTGGPYQILTQWGVSENVLCVGNDKTLKFVDDVLKEVCDIFPSKYFHVGGDECPKVVWETCPKCQKRIKDNNLQADGKHSAEERLQSYMINHAEKYLNTLGRQLIGWDETLEGGLAPNATVMSWRGEEGGFEAVRQKHDVIMTPNTFLYFDYYQTDQTETEPMAIGGYLPIERVYSYEPIPAKMTPEEAKYIIGVQANCWTEYMKTFKQVEYMMLPRVAALSEIQWCAPEHKDFEKFSARLKRLMDLYDVKDYNYSRVINNVRIHFETDMENHTSVVTLASFNNTPIYYTLDGSAPTKNSLRYTEPLVIKNSTKIRAAVITDKWQSPEVEGDIRFNKATAKKITLLTEPNSGYVFTGAPLLIDGLTTTNLNFRNGRWIGFNPNDLIAVIDLEEETEIKEATINTNVQPGDWIFDARGFEVYGSMDGKEYTKIAGESYPQMTKEADNMQKIITHTLKFNPTKVRYVKVIVRSEHAAPAWHGANGKEGFLFVDEIVLN